VLAALWRYRHFILAMIRGDLKARLTRSYIGAGWFILQPFAQALIFAMVLSEGLGARLPNVESKYAYAVFVLSGMAAWGFFSEIVNRCITVFTDYSSTLKKIAFPRLCLPVIVLGTALVNHAMVLLATMVLFGFFGHYPGMAWLILPFGVVPLAAFAFGIGLICGVFNVFSRDIGNAFGVILQIWFWLTPIVYPPEALPPTLRPLLDNNPMTPVVNIYQDAILRNQWPDAAGLTIPIILSAALLFSALVFFRRSSSELVDAL